MHDISLIIRLLDGWISEGQRTSTLVVLAKALGVPASELLADPRPDPWIEEVVTVAAAMPIHLRPRRAGGAVGDGGAEVEPAPGKVCALEIASAQRRAGSRGSR